MKILSKSVFLGIFALGLIHCPTPPPPSRDGGTDVVTQDQQTADQQNPSDTGGACGAMGQACCMESSGALSCGTSGTLVCDTSNNTCVSCGQMGDLCCTGTAQCGSSLECDPQATVGRCITPRTCGHAEEACCTGPNDQPCNPTLSCTNNVCTGI